MPSKCISYSATTNVNYSNILTNAKNEASGVFSHAVKWKYVWRFSVAYYSYITNALNMFFGLLNLMQLCNWNSLLDLLLRQWVVLC